MSSGAGGNGNGDGGSGFGGGGGGASNEGGGGGGYNGGDGGEGSGIGPSGEGGYSFYNSEKVIGTPLHAAGENNGNGQVTICWSTPDPPVPTLSEWGLIILGLCLAVFAIIAANQRIYIPA